MGAAQGLAITNNSGTPNTSIDIGIDQAVLINPTGNVPIYVAGPGFFPYVTIDCTTTGAGGLDTGALANSTWYHLYLISNGTNFYGLASLSATAPQIPAT